MDWSVFISSPAGGMRAARDRPPSVTEVLPDLLVGEYPRLEDIEWLRDEYAITAVHNLQDDDDLRLYGFELRSIIDAYAKASLKMVRTPIPDGSAGQFALHLERALNDLKALTDAGDRVYLHCNAGLNRAPSVAIAFMHAHRGMSLDQALAHLKRRRACGPFMTVLQEHFGTRRSSTDK